MRVTRQDWLSPANAITIIGLLLTTWGSFQLDNYTGIGLVVLGRYLDLLDGHIARRTHSSPLGALIDAAADKIAIVCLIVGGLLTIHGSGYFSAFLYFVLIQNSVNGLLALWWLVHGKDIKPVRAGKRAMFGQVICIISIALLNRLGDLDGNLLEILLLYVPVAALVLATIAYSLAATIQYFRAVIGIYRSPKTN